jgi:2-hydroxychromene-2-carboxylate isomerase
MTLRDQLFGIATSQFLRHERTVRRATDRRRGLDVFLQIDDAHGWLLVQLLGRLLDDLPDEEVRVFVVGPPAPDVDPEPALRIAWALRDARLLSQYHGLEGPTRAEVPTAEVVAQAQRILLRERPGRETLRLAHQILRAVWTDDHAGLQALSADHGELSALEATQRLLDHAAVLTKLGHYQGSMVRHRGEWFWGVDRFPLLARSLGRPESPLAWAEGVPAPPGLVDPDGRVRIELFFSFRSPYSYLILQPLYRLASRPRVDLVIRPVLPMVMRGLPVPRAKRLYLLPDVHRLARDQGVPFGKACDPVGKAVERCMGVFQIAQEQGRERAFVEQAATAIWSRAANLALDAELKPVVERSGLRWSDAERGMADETGWRRMVTENRAALIEEMGLWGVPSMRIGGQVALWGQDRVPILARMLDDVGV